MRDVSILARTKFEMAPATTLTQNNVLLFSDWLGQNPKYIFSSIPKSYISTKQEYDVIRIVKMLRFEGD